MIAGLTIGAVILLIFVGGIVRMTGSGMGCPDWPKCFGQWVPPTDLSELPPDYKTQFQVQGKEIADFDPFKTWVEYLNRLLGVLIGFFCVLTAAWSLRIPRQSFRSVRRFSLLALFLVIVQGGLGAYVVRTDLKVGVVTLHMLLAIVIVAVLILGFLTSFTERKIAPVSPSLQRIGILLLVVTLVQIILGTQVREAVDSIAIQLGEAQRGDWLSEIGSQYQIHRYFYYAVVATLMLFALRLRPYFAQIPGSKLAVISLMALVLLEVVFGISMHHLGIPPILQPLHLVLATIIFAVEFTLIASWWVWKGNGIDKQLSPTHTNQELVGSKLS